MGILALCLSLIYLATLVWLLVRAFKTGVGWGLAVLFIPFAFLVYARKHWDEAKKPFLAHLAAAVCLGILFAFYFSAALNGMKPSHAARALPPGAQRPAATQEPKTALDLTKKGLDLLEKFPQNEKNKKLIAFTREYIRHKKTGSTDAQLAELKQATKEILQRSDLAATERQNFEKVLQDLEREKVTVASVAPENRPPEKKEKPEASALKPPAAIEPAIPPPPPPIKEVVPEPQEASLPGYKEIRLDQAKDYIGSTVILTHPDGEEERAVLTGVSGRSLQFEKRLGTGAMSYSYQNSEIQSMKVFQK